MRIPEAFAKVNNYGVFQKLILFVLAIGAGFQGMQTSASNFITTTHEKWCRVTQLQNFSYDQQKRIAIPQDAEGEYDSCNAFDVNWNNFTTRDFVSWNRSIYEDGDIVPCDDFVFSQDVFTETANSKWGLVCSQDLISEIMSISYVAGMFVGSILAGRISDGFGRWTAQLISCSALIASHFVAAFIDNYIVFMVCRFIAGTFIRGLSMSASVLMLEICGPKQREFAGILAPCFYSIGVMLCAGCAYSLRDFQLLQLVMGGMSLCMMGALIVIPESPRWLLAKGKVTKAENIMRWIGTINESPLPDDFSLKQPETQGQKKKQLSYFQLFKYPLLRKHVLIMHVLWITVSYSNLAMTLNLGSLTGDPYLNVFISGITSFPTTFLVLVSLKKLGRRMTFIVFGIVFVACNAIAIPFEIISDLGIIATVATILARAFVGALLSDIRVLNTELFPTSIRQQTLGITSGFAAGLGISASYVGGSLRNVWAPLPNVVFGVLGVFGVLAASFLPETKGNRLPDSIEDAIKVGLGTMPKVGTPRTISYTVDTEPENAEKSKEKSENGVAVSENGMGMAVLENGVVVVDNKDATPQNSVVMTENGISIFNENGEAILDNESDQDSINDDIIIVHL